MAILNIKTPNIMTMEFRQEKNDPDYGSCVWAVFHFDLDRYTLMIESDCGNYTYGWHPTSQFESFLHLMGRLDEEYLLDKLSDRTVVDTETTWKAVEEYLKSVENRVIEDHAFNHFDEEDEEEENDEEEFKLTDDDWQDVRDACSESSEAICYWELKEALAYTPLDGVYGEFELCECINLTYPARAKSIVRIFMEYIRPKCRELTKEEQV